MPKSILITGCSSGIGLCAAETLHKKGYRVFATARKKSDVEKGLLYKALLLMRLDYKKLPKALQVDAIGSDDWKMTSQRFEWTPSLFK